MAAGFVSKTLSTLATSVARWIEFGDGSQAPVHGAIMVDPATGLPIDTSAPTLVKQQDSSPVGASRSTTGDFFIVDMDGYESLTLQVIGTFTGATFTFEAGENQVDWKPVNGMVMDAAATGAWASQFGAVGFYRIPRVARYIKVSLTSISTGTVQIMGNKGQSVLLPQQRTGEGNEVSHPYALPSRYWKYAAASGGILNTMAVTLQAANATYAIHVLGFTIQNTHASVDNEVSILDGGTAIWRGKVKAGQSIAPAVNLRGTTNQALSVQCSAAGEVYVNAYGYLAR